MNFHWPFSRKPKPHHEPRYYAATGAERKLARRRYLDRQLELAVAVSTLSDEQRAAAKARGAIREGRG